MSQIMRCSQVLAGVAGYCGPLSATSALVRCAGPLLSLATTTMKVGAVRMTHKPHALQARMQVPSGTTTVVSCRSSHARKCMAWLSSSSAQSLEPQIVSLTVNGRKVTVPQGSSVLDAARTAGVYLPSLCYHPNLKPTGTCRLCLVDIVRNNPARGKPVVACATPAANGMVVLTTTPELSQHVHDQVYLQRRRHPDKCQTCSANGSCEFQDLIARYNVEKPPYVNPRVKPGLESNGVAHARDSSSPALDLDFQMCVLCLRCVRACNELQGMNILGVVARGNDEVVAPVYSLDLNDTECISCGACVASCPVAAITEKDAVIDVKQLLENNIDINRLKNQTPAPASPAPASPQSPTPIAPTPVKTAAAVAVDEKEEDFVEDLRKYVTVVQTAPAVRVTLSEAFGLPPGSTTTGQLVSALKMIGFDYVFDTNFTADLTIVEEAYELLERLKNGGPFPMFTSCCPAWVNMVEKVYPELIPNLSTCKSPQQMFGAVAKTYFAKKIGRPPSEVKVVSVMPCVAKKDEASRAQLRSAASFSAKQQQPQQADEEMLDVDYVLTTRELARLIKMHRPKIHYQALPDAPFDSPLGETTGAALLFGATGGVMEAALRTAHAVTAPKHDITAAMPRLRFEEVRGLQGIRETTVDLHGTPLKVAVACQGANVRELVERIRAAESNMDTNNDTGGGRGGGEMESFRGIKFVEMMACRGGCIGGAGNPKDAVDTKLLEKRAAAIYSGDEQKVVRRSHENQELKKLYEEFLGHPNSERAHQLLHTKYEERESEQTKFMKEESFTSDQVLERHLH
mmetsp:Transcript_651/g.1245  ORF Transcript_651/g.1245 Transcript_651/m.1245 type:complete len:798 (-) Transcript_651:196-2589(-)